MSLSTEQKQQLNDISRQLRSIEEFAIQNNIDLDVFMTQYSKKGIAVYGTEKVSMKNDKAEKRKRVFEKSSEPSTESVRSAH
jgi:hypothetical protein